MRFIPAFGLVLLALAGCSKPFTAAIEAQACSLIPGGEEAAYTKAYSGHNYEGVLARFAVAKGLISEVQYALITVNVAEWPEGIREQVAVCWVEPKGEE